MTDVNQSIGHIDKAAILLERIRFVGEEIQNLPPCYPEDAVTDRAGLK